MRAQGFANAESAEKLAIFGALRLYLDFINLFISLLRIFGGGRRYPLTVIYCAGIAGVGRLRRQLRHGDGYCVLGGGIGWRPGGSLNSRALNTRHSPRPSDRSSHEHEDADDDCRVRQDQPQHRQDHRHRDHHDDEAEDDRQCLRQPVGVKQLVPLVSQAHRSSITRSSARETQSRGRRRPLASEGCSASLSG